MTDPGTIRTEPNLLRQPVHPEITEAVIRDLVFAFYGRIAEEPTLGPLFRNVIGEDWDPHLAKMCDFWSSVMRMSGRYKGKPMLAHARVPGLELRHFDLWLRLFQDTAREVCRAEIADIFVDRAERIAESLQLGIFQYQSADPRAARPD